VALRFGLFLDAPVLSWSAVVGTLALALWWNRGIERGHRCLEQQVLTVRPVALPQEP
jgi:hypothetical protein